MPKRDSSPDAARRNFLKGAGLIGAAAAVAPLAFKIKNYLTMLTKAGLDFDQFRWQRSVQIAMAEKVKRQLRMNQEPPKTASTIREVAVALQGGGSHGAFTWGVLDRLLEEPTLKITGATGASAGAMNAVILVDALVRAGTEEARRALRRYWASIGKMPSAANSTVSPNASPYDLNPSNFNPLRELLTEMIDFERLRSQNALQVAVCATNVWSAKRRVFDNKDISVDAVLASACLPQMSPAVEIDGEPYWDGGWTGNPAIHDILNDMDVHDLIIVRIDPIVRKETPRTQNQILDRMIEISFNSTFFLSSAQSRSSSSFRMRKGPLRASARSFTASTRPQNLQILLRRAK